MPTASGARLPPVVVGLVGNGEVSSLPQPGMSPPMSSPTTPPTSSFRTSISPVAHHHFYRRDEIDLHDPVEGLADEAGHDHANDEERIQLLGHHDSPAFRATLRVALRRFDHRMLFRFEDRRLPMVGQTLDGRVMQRGGDRRLLGPSLKVCGR